MNKEIFISCIKCGENVTKEKTETICFECLDNLLAKLDRIEEKLNTINASLNLKR